MSEPYGMAQKLQRELIFLININEKDDPNQIETTKAKDNVRQLLSRLNQDLNLGLNLPPN